MAKPTPSVKVLDDFEEPLPPTKEQVREYAEFIGIDPDSEPHLMWIALEGVLAPVPHPWKMCTENDEDMFYFNFETGESVWDHPSDDKFRDLVELCRKKGEGPAGLLDAESSGLFHPMGAGMRFGLPPIYEVSCSDAEESMEERQMTTADSNGSSYEDSSDADHTPEEEHLERRIVEADSSGSAYSSSDEEAPIERQAEELPFSHDEERHSQLRRESENQEENEHAAASETCGAAHSSDAEDVDAEEQCIPPSTGDVATPTPNEVSDDEYGSDFEPLERSLSASSMKDIGTSDLDESESLGEDMLDAFALARGSATPTTQSSPSERSSAAKEDEQTPDGKEAEAASQQESDLHVSKLDRATATNELPEPEASAVEEVDTDSDAEASKPEDSVDDDLPKVVDVAPTLELRRAESEAMQQAQVATRIADAEDTEDTDACASEIVVLHKTAETEATHRMADPDDADLQTPAVSEPEAVETDVTEVAACDDEQVAHAGASEYEVKAMDVAGQLLDVQTDLRTILDVLGQLSQVRSESSKNLQMLIQHTKEAIQTH
jgi:centrosomal protein CEP164